MTQIGQRIAQLRAVQEVSQSELAKRMGTSQSAVSQLEAGSRNPSFETLRAAARALNVSLAQLVGAESEELTPEEQLHFRNLRQLSEDSQRELQEFTAFLLSRARERNAK